MYSCKSPILSGSYIHVLYMYVHVQCSIILLLNTCVQVLALYNKQTELTYYDDENYNNNKGKDQLELK